MQGGVCVCLQVKIHFERGPIFFIKGRQNSFGVQELSITSNFLIQLGYNMNSLLNYVFFISIC